jgi:hypothetical protein|tara:strand:- start:566 stop:733 length:168 start_codon:yes stop_codon:yes gene_type:complete
MIKGNEMKLEDFDEDASIAAPVITVVEDGENMFLELMAEELGLEKLCEMNYEEIK